MKRVAILATLGLLLSSVASHSYPATPDEAALLALEHSWADAASTHDVVVLDNLLDDLFVDVTANGTRRSKADVLAAPGLPAGSSQSLDDLHARVTGDVAVVTGVNHYRPAPDAKAIDFVFTDVYAKRPDGWRAVSSHMTRKPGDGA